MSTYRIGVKELASLSNTLSSRTVKVVSKERVKTSASVNEISSGYKNILTVEP